MFAYTVILPVIAFCITEAAEPFTDSDDPENSINRLKKMKEWGENVRQYLPSVSGNASQFIVVAIYSKNEDFKNGLGVNLDNGCPKEKVPNIKMYECKTSAVLYNEKLHANDTRWKNIQNAEDFKNKINKTCINQYHPFHGESILIHGGILEKLLSNYWKDSGSGEKMGKNSCEIYLYSHYIPCAGIENCPYSCAEEIMDYNKKAHVTCKFTAVGYSLVFSKTFIKKKETKCIGTDLTLSTNFLEMGNVEVFQLTAPDNAQAVPQTDENVPANQNRVKRRTSGALSMNSGQIIFQDMMYACLKRTPLSMCCLSSTPDGFNQQKILSLFVNLMVYYCTSNSTGVGSISSRSLPDLKRCFSSWLQDNIGSDCRICSDGSLRSAWHQQYLVAFCIDSILDWVTTFGRPYNGWDLTNPTWVPWNGPWNKLYLESPHTFKRRVNLFCENKMLDIGSMCTRMNTKTIRNKSMQNELINKCLWPKV